MNISIHTITRTVNIPICMSKEDIKAAREEDAEFEMLRRYTIRGMPHTKDAVELGVERNWPIRHEPPNCWYCNKGKVHNYTSTFAEMNS